MWKSAIDTLDRASLELAFLNTSVDCMPLVDKEMQEDIELVVRC